MFQSARHQTKEAARLRRSVRGCLDPLQYPDTTKGKVTTRVVCSGNGGNHNGGGTGGGGGGGDRGK